ncbi:MAG: epoxyqueuosine reductase [Clostridiaceae bacterium]
MDLAAVIKEIINEETRKAEAPYPYREPLVGFADANDPMFDKLTEIIGNEQVHPTEILPSASTVVVFFLPYSEEMIKKLREHPQVPIAQEWSDYYTVTNKVLSDISDRLTEELEKLGIRAGSQPPTNNYNEDELTAKWGHKSAAVISGIGTFGLNHLIVTKYGTMGRLNSLVIDAWIEPTPRAKTEYCLYYKSGKCRFCVENCPSGALSMEGIDKFRCDAYLNGKNVRDSQQGCPGCSSGPCAFKGFE